MSDEPVHVSDHALLRYLERAHDIDIEAVRRHIAGMAMNAAALGALSVKIEGIKIVLAKSRVPTVLDRRAIPTWPGKEPT